MLPDLGDLNWLSIIIAVVAVQVIGFLWYGPLFGKQWMTAIGKTPEEQAAAGGQVGPAVAVGVVMTLVRAIILALLIGLSATPDVGWGIKIGLMLAAVTISGIIMTHQYEQRPGSLTVVNSGFEIALWVVMGAIIGGMW